MAKSSKEDQAKAFSKRIINFALQDPEKIKAMGIKHYCFD